MSDCTHTRNRLVKGGYDVYTDEDLPDVMEPYSTTEDLDTHRYRCTQCGLVMYYSGAARAYYEEGKLSYVPGLDK
jgi:hypothetical protein